MATPTLPDRAIDLTVRRMCRLDAPSKAPTVRVDRSTAGHTTAPREIAAGVYWLPCSGSNVYFVRSGRTWVLVDAAWANAAGVIRRAAEAVFGANTPPAAIVLTHLHPDHTDAAPALAREWGCPVYVHPAELPLARAQAMADLAAMERFANPLDRRVILPLLHALPRRRVATMLSQTGLADVACALEPGGAVPGLPDWACVFTRGHSPGHVAFFRARDRVLIAGDAVLTVDGNSLAGLLAWGLGCTKPGAFAPPWYTNWRQPATEASLAVLADLEPRVLATGHGRPLIGDAAAPKLRALTDRVAGNASHRAAGASALATAFRAAWVGRRSAPANRPATANRPSGRFRDQ